jgi:hypothetical protein
MSINPLEQANDSARRVDRPSPGDRFSPKRHRVIGAADHWSEIVWITLLAIPDQFRDERRMRLDHGFPAITLPDPAAR